MADLRYQFENEIKLKISQKAKSNLSDETSLAKYFRYFDLNNSGTVSAEEFQKTLIKIGITSVDNDVNSNSLHILLSHFQHTLT